MMGRTLGPYEVVARLGAGGMGEVYRARDPKLNRDVALKVLPAAAALDGERRERFQREAQAIAALNHPNIVTIYSVEDADGTTFLTMELVEGRPLSEALPKSGLPLGRLLAIGIDVADALAAAHQKGITHRDLKPANIMLGEGEHQGRVKVLDFGLAKLTHPVAADSSRTELPTALVTGEGRILGTVAYMSPEQAEGKPIDARSDLFSLGVILYEMATGRRPFTGDTSVSIISSIVKDTPASIAELNPTLPRELARIIRRALAKDPEARYQTAKDLRNDLRELRGSLESGELALEAGAPMASARGRSVRLWQAVAVVAGLTAIAAVVLLLRRSAPLPTASTSPSAAIQMTRLTSGVMASRPAISPDGKFVAYVQTSADDQDSVWVRQIATGSTVQIVAPAPKVKIWGLAVTPDGAFVDYVRWSTTTGLRAIELWRVPLLGGPSRTIVDRATSAPGWSPDGRHMAFLTQNESQTERSVVVADADGGHPRVVATRKLPLRYLTDTLSSRPDIYPVWLPDGRTVVVWARDERKGQAGEQLVKVDIASGAETPLVTLADTGGSLALAPDGASVLTSTPAEPGGPLQVARVRLAGGAITWLTTDLDAYRGLRRAGDSLVAARTEVRTRFWVGDGAGRDFTPVGPEVVSDARSRIVWTAPDTIAYVASRVGGSGLWTTDLASSAAQLLVPGANGVVATADGRTIVYEGDSGQLWRADADGTHASQLPGARGSLVAVAPDGSAVFYISDQSGLQTAWTTSLQGGSPRQFSETQVGAGGIAVSPDSRLVALESASDTAFETRIVPIGGGPASTRLPPMPSRDLQWTPDGKGLASVDAARTNIWVQPIDGGSPYDLTHFTDQSIFAFAWSPDGKRLVVWRGTRTSDIVLLTGIR
jgi:eukaryotic-like serine/threonine-protein kinase